jgi:hypothetical protein
VPLTESTYFILLTAHEPPHGYAIMKDAVAQPGAVMLSTGTLYSASAPAKSAGSAGSIRSMDRMVA